MAVALAREVLALLRAGRTIPAPMLRDWVNGMADGSIDDAQVGAFAMATCRNGMDAQATMLLTQAMRDSGQVLDWRGFKLNGPVVDKHSTGGVGDGTSLVLGPMLAAVGCHVPMISGRGLGHTGGTLDKLEALPGYRVDVEVDELQRVVAQIGIAIVSATAALAPADRRLYTIRDRTSTVDSIPLITASILSKKLAESPTALVLDIKIGAGANLGDVKLARELSQSLLACSRACGVATQSVFTAMDQPLGPSIGNATEVRLALDYLCARLRPERFHQVVIALGATLMVDAGVAPDIASATARLVKSIDSGAAAERFAQMIARLGGPRDVLTQQAGAMPLAPIVAPILATRDGHIASINAPAVGVAVMSIGGGRHAGSSQIDHRVGIEQLLSVASQVQRGQPLAILHAADRNAWDQAAAAVLGAIQISDDPVVASPTLLDHLPS